MFNYRNYNKHFYPSLHFRITGVMVGCIPLSMGIEFGAVGFGGKVESVKYAGAGRCMLVK